MRIANQKFNEKTNITFNESDVIFIITASHRSRSGCGLEKHSQDFHEEISIVFQGVMHMHEEVPVFDGARYLRVEGGEVVQHILVDESSSHSFFGQCQDVWFRMVFL